MTERRRKNVSFSLWNMQQYFSSVPIVTGGTYIFTKEQAHHARDVVRLDHEKVRIVYEGTGYFGICRSEGKDFVADIVEKDERVNESSVKLTICQALIRREKFELILQKAAELGAVKIVPFESSRCVVRAKSEKAGKQLARWNEIVREASEQCKRNSIPEVTEIRQFADLSEIEGEVKMAAYENAFGKSSFISDVLTDQNSAVIVIGPEGGFSEAEVEQLRAMGYVPVTFGSRILRAETAAVYGCAIVSEIGERRHKQ